MKPTRSEALTAPVQPFTFHDTTLDVARDNGDLWVSIRRVCEALGIDFSGQLQKLKKKPWGRVSFIAARRPEGMEMNSTPSAMLHLDALPMWLATIEPSRVSPEARPRLERFQLECAKALRDHFFGKAGPGEAMNATPASDPRPPSPAPSSPRTVDNTPSSEWTTEMVQAAIKGNERRMFRKLNAASRAALFAFLNDRGSSRWRMWAGIARVLVDVEHEVRSNVDQYSAASALETISDILCERANVREAERSLAAARPRFVERTELVAPAPADDLDELLLELAVLTENRRVTAGEIMRAAETNEGLRRALERAAHGRVTANAVGRLLSRLRGVTVEGWAIAGELGGHNKQWRWWVARGAELS